MLEDTPPSQRREIADAVHAALVEVAGVPPAERFQLVSAHAPTDLFFDARFPGVERRRPVFVQITLVRELGSEAKRLLFRVIAGRLNAAGVRGDDVFTVITENELTDWSAANGLPHLLDSV